MFAAATATLAAFAAAVVVPVGAAARVSLCLMSSK